MVQDFLHQQYGVLAVGLKLEALGLQGQNRNIEG